jgi:uncharacterized protein (TIGR03435 family)
MELDHFDIEAKSVDRTGMISAEAMAPMIQSLLQDRFQLKTHREARNLTVYELVIAKNGLKMKKSADKDSQAPEASTYAPAGPGPRGSLVQRGPSTLIGNAIPLGPLVSQLSRFLDGAPVLDKTNLKDLFDFSLQWTPEPIMPPGQDAPVVSEPYGPSIFTAVREQLGLRLEATKGAVEVVVIDSVQKPSVN